MDEHDDRKLRVQASVMRVLIVAVVAGAFVTMASYMTPEQTRAMPHVERGLDLLRPSTAKVPPNAARPPSRTERGWMLLGEMVGRDNRVWVYGKGAEVRYTICTIQGDVLMAELAADEVYRLFPHLDIMGMHLNPSPQVSDPVTATPAADAASGPLMIADSPQGSPGR